MEIKLVKQDFILPSGRKSKANHSKQMVCSDMNGRTELGKAPVKRAQWKDIASIVRKMKAAKEEALRRVQDLHVYHNNGNEKTGNIPCYSLLPILDCSHNCEQCKRNCYDVRHDVIKKECLMYRAINSAIHEADPVRYWTEIETDVKRNEFAGVRFNEGGDFTQFDFKCLHEMGKRCSKTDFLAFTKNYEAVNETIDELGDFADNTHVIMSAWFGTEMNNKHNLPESHVIDGNGGTTVKGNKMVVYCPNNCTNCLMKSRCKSCWNLEKGEAVLLHLH